jgi:hypothetical protein
LVVQAAGRWSSPWAPLAAAMAARCLGNARGNEFNSFYRRACLEEGVTAITRVSHAIEVWAQRGGKARRSTVPTPEAGRHGSVQPARAREPRGARGEGQRVSSRERVPPRVDRWVLAGLGVRFQRDRDAGPCATRDVAHVGAVGPVQISLGPY